MRTRNRIAGLLRLSLLVLVCSALAVFWVGQRAHAYSERVLERLGDHMLRYVGAQHQTVPQQFDVNGATFFLSTGSVAAPMSEVLDQFHAKCVQKNGRLHEQWANLAKKRKLKLQLYPSTFDGVFRKESSKSGIVACAETGDGTLPPEVLISRIKDVLATGDIAKLGNLRYVYVTPDQKETVFVALWTEGPLNFRSMFPKQGDAPGEDLAGIPRPPDSRRILSTRPKGADAVFNVYRSSRQSADELVDFYRDALPKAGYTLLTKKQRFLVAENGKRALTISLQDDTRTGHGLVTIATQPN
jgi:hypothetical protein